MFFFFFFFFPSILDSVGRFFSPQFIAVFDFLKRATCVRGSSTHTHTHIHIHTLTHTHTHTGAQQANNVRGGRSKQRASEQPICGGLLTCLLARSLPCRPDGCLPAWQDEAEERV